MMDHAQILELFDRETRIEADWPWVTREVFPYLIRHLANGASGHFIAYSRLPEERAGDLIAGQVRYFRELGQPVEWKVFDHDAPADLRDRLQAQGFECGEPEALMILDLSHLPRTLTAPNALDIRRLTSPDQLEPLNALLQSVWQEDYSFLVRDLAHIMAHAPDFLSVFYAYEAGSPVSVGWTFYLPQSQFAGLYGGSTLPEFRKRGFYTALVARRAQEARERGVRYLTIDAGPMSRPILEKLGFEFFGFSHPCMLNPAAGLAT